MPLVSGHDFLLFHLFGELVTGPAVHLFKLNLAH